MQYDDFRNMSVWQKAAEIVVIIYDVTKSFPSEEKFGLISDMRRAANSIAHNIAEGYGRFEPKDKTRFYKISRGSCFEIMSQCFVSQKLNFVENNRVNIVVNECQDVIKELNAIIKTLESK